MSIFNFLSKQKKVVNISPDNIVVAEINNEKTGATKKYPIEVEQIHREFECAGDELLRQAQQWIDKAHNTDADKAKRLMALGFNQAKGVQEVKKVIEQAELSKETVELVNYYKKNYPFNKFITEAQVKEICLKYNLVCGEFGRYLGFVPEVKLREIERFKLKEEDEYVSLHCWSTSNSDYSIKNDWILVPKKQWKQVKNEGMSDEGKWTYGKSLGINANYAENPTEVSFQICAPQKEMDMTGMTISEGYKMKKHIPDPVVLQPVKNGYLIVTAWGDEASDPIVVNEINN